METKATRGNKSILSESSKKYVKVLLTAAAAAVLLESLIFNISSLRTLGNRPGVMAESVTTGTDGTYVTPDITADARVENIYIEDLDITNAEYAEVTVTLTDEGDEYEYDLPSARVVPGVRGSGYINIYPYGKVNTIRVKISVSDGASAGIGRISFNAHKPWVIRPVRLLATFLALSILICAFKFRFNIPLKRKDKRQTICVITMFVLLIALGRWLSVSNDLMVSCPWPHHRQYQDLAVSLSKGTVRLTDYEVSGELLAKENPYDTIALNVEGIPYKMDAAFYNGSYFVYFGIVPELLLYFPYHLITGGSLANYNADLILYVLFVAGVFICTKELIFRFAPDEKNENTSRIPFATYLLMCISTCLLSNTVYLISRPDIYNIPIMAATAFTFTGLGLWLKSCVNEGRRKILCMSAGSLCMALVAGCRPQLLIFSVAAVFIFRAFRRIERVGDKKKRIMILPEGWGILEIAAFILPYVLVAVPVCAYNYLRFGNIFDFGATYSLTTNDMNHRGFNADRLIRGLYCFFLQPPVMETDFPYIGSSVIESSYMGKNLTEYTYGGSYVTNLILLSVIVPVFYRIKGLGREAKAMLITFIAGAVIIAGFDVNGAGILYRYTCDMIPGLIIAALIIWILLLKDELTAGTAQRVYAVLMLFGLFYSFLVFMGTDGSVSLMENSVRLYEDIRQGFMW